MATATKERKPKAEKKVQLVARVAFKSNPAIVVYLVRSSNSQDVYQTTLYAGNAASCTCPARKPCYHLTQVQAIEANRQEELAVAASVAPLVVGEQFAADLAEHVADEVANEPAIVLVDADGENALVLRYGQEFVMRVEELAEIGEYEEVFSLLDFEQIKSELRPATTFEQEAFAILDHERREQASLNPQTRQFETVNDRPVLMR